MYKKSPQKFDKIWYLEYNWVSNFIILYDQMKQKRKVKSLIPQKNDWRSSFLTAILLILSVALCIWSASLITSTVRAAEPWVIASFTYTWLDENQEVLYGMRFVDRDDISEPVNYIYIKWKSLYITPNPVIVNPLAWSESINTTVNEVEPGVYGHVLWGYKNKVKSDNVTLIAWEENVVPENNDNAVLLWWKYNNDFGPMRGWGTPMVVVWWSNNSIWDDHDGVALIWWQNNHVWKSVSNAFILWWESNEINDNRSNVIIWWKNVIVDEDNVFVYSSDDNEFKPDSSNAFYLNVKNWVGINTASSDRGLAVKGAVNLGKININLQSCTGDNFWVIWNYDWCVVWCTKAGKNAIPNGKWEMLDRGEHCQTVCSNNSNHCIYTGDYITPEPDYNSFCTTWVVNTWHAELCFPDSLAEHKNSVFETVLVDYEACPSPEGENKCVYQCKDWYHLAKDTTSSPSLGTKCFADCNLAEKLKDPSGNSDWYDINWKPIIIKHNVVVTGYNKSVVDCAGYWTINPSGYPSRDYGTYLDNGFGTKRPNRPNKIGSTPIGVPFWLIQNKNPDKLPEHCGNNAHKQELVCVNWEVYISRGGKATSIKAIQDWTLGDNYLWYAHNGYVYQHCDTKNYRCDGSYNLTKDIITKSFEEGGFADSGDGWNNIQDRDKFRLKRWTYKLCLDYNRVAGDNETCEILDRLNPHVKHYKFVECNNDNGYYKYTDEDWVVRCKEQCKVTAKNAEWQQETITVKHKEKYEFYLSWSATCTGVCESQRFECNDGTFYATWWANNGRKREDLSYKYSECALYDNKCSRDEYNVTASQFEQWKSKWEYVSCDDYLNLDTDKPRDPRDNPTKNTDYNKQCRKDETNYKLVRCYPGYHTEDWKMCEDNVKDMPCPLKPNYSHWVRTSALTSYPYSSIITYYKTYLESWKYLKWWNENCAWNGSTSTCWEDELQDWNNGKVIPGDACEWECDTWYRRNGNVCEHIDTTCKYPNGCDYSGEPYACVDSNANVENKRLENGTWKWNCVNGLTDETKSCSWCDKWYHRVGDRCVANENGVCDNANNKCSGNWIKSNRNGIYEWYEYNGVSEQVLLWYTYECLGLDGPADLNHEYGTSNELYMCPEAENVSCQFCVFWENPDWTCKEPLCGDGDNPLTSSDWIIIWKWWYPNITWNPKNWSFRGYSSYNSSLNNCQWTCDDTDGYEKNGNGCKLRTYTISYDENGWTPDQPDETVTHGDSVYVPNVERECYYFDGWKGKLWDWYKYSRYWPVYESETLVAQWSANDYLITYDCDSNNGWSGNPWSQRVTYGTPANVKSSGCTKSNYHFVWWSTHKNADTPMWGKWAQMNGILTNSCENRTLYAVYEENDKCVISFDSDGWSAVASQSLYCGNAWTEPADPTKTCYTFDKWVTPKASTTAYDWSKAVNSDITLYAKWTAKQYTITYNCNGWSGNPWTQSVTYGTTAYVKDGGCSKQDYNFVWWSTNSSATTPTWALWAQMNGILTSSCENKTLYAVYSKLKNGVCDESEPYWCMNDDPAVERGEITSSAGDVIGVNWYCQWADGKSPQCKYKCDDGETFDTINDVCVDNSDYDRTCVGVCEGSSSTTTQENYCVWLTSYQCNLDPSCVWEFGTCNHKIWWWRTNIPDLSTAACDDKPKSQCNGSCKWSEVPVCLDVSNQSCVNAASQWRFNINIDCMDETLSKCSWRAPSCGGWPQPNNDCSATTKGGYDISAMSNNQTKTVYRDITYWQCKATAKCTDWSVSIEDESCCADSISYLSNSIKITACRWRYNQSAAESITIADKNVWASTRSLTSYGTQYKWIDDLMVRYTIGWGMSPTCYVAKEFWRLFNSDIVSDCPGTFMLDVPAAENIKDRCWAWYEVPTYMDWNNLVELFNNLHVDLLSNIAGSSRKDKFSNALYLPRGWANLVSVGHPGVSNDEIVMCYQPWYEDGWRLSHWYNQNVTYDWWFYWSSSANWDSYLYDWVWYFDVDKMDAIDAADYRNKFYVRCFKS